MRILYQSPQIFIREFYPSEEHLFSSFFENEAISRFLPRRSQEEYEVLFREALIDYQNSPFGRWGIFDSDTKSLIGNCLFRKFAEVPDQMEIGYSLSPEYWGKGIATEVALALIHYGFANTTSNEIVALTETGNIGSQKVLKKAGFEKRQNLKRKDLILNYYCIIREL